MQPTRRQRTEVALEELRANGSGAEQVFEWFGERDAEKTEAWLGDCEASLRSLEEDAELPAGLRGDWLSALPAAWVFVRQGDAHPLATPFVEARDGMTTLGRGSSRVTVFRGPVRLEGRVRVKGMVVIVGDLTVEGFLEHFTDPGDCLMVVGNESVRSVRVGWAHFVMGALTAQVRFWSYDAINDGLMHVTGPCDVALELEDHSGGDGGFGEVAGSLEPQIDGELTGERVCELVAAGTCRVIPRRHALKR